MVFVEVEQSVATKEGGQYAPACLATMATPTLAVFRESVMRTVTVAHRGLARTTSVWTPVASAVDKGQTAVYRTTWQYADAPGEQLEIHSEAADALQELRFALLVEKTLTVRWVKTTDPFADVNLRSLETLSKDVVMSVIPTVSVALASSVIGRATAV